MIDESSNCQVSLFFSRVDTHKIRWCRIDTRAATIWEGRAWSEVSWRTLIRWRPEVHRSIALPLSHPRGPPASTPLLSHLPSLLTLGFLDALRPDILQHTPPLQRCTRPTYLRGCTSTSTSAFAVAQRRSDIRAIRSGPSRATFLRPHHVSRLWRSLAAS